MKNYIFVLTAVAALTGTQTSAFAGALIIDRFDSALVGSDLFGTQSVEVSPGNFKRSQRFAVNALGRSRAITLAMDGGASSDGTMSVVSSDPGLVVSDVSGFGSSAAVLWDAEGDGLGDLLAGTRYFEIGIPFVGGAAFDLVLGLNDADDTDASATVRVDIGFAGVLELPLAAFANASVIDLMRIDAVSLTLSPVAGSSSPFSAEISYVTAVPTAAPLPLLLLGLATLWSVRQPSLKAQTC